MANLSADDIAELVTRYGFADPRTAVAVVLGESGGNPNAVNRKNANGTVDRGLWQINSVHEGAISASDMFDIDKSTAFALKLSSGGTDFNAWSVTRSDRWPELYETAGKAKVPGSERSPGVADLVGASPVGGAVGAVGDAVGSIVAGPAAVLDLAAKALGVVTSLDFWRRVGFVVAGVAVLALGIYLLFGKSIVRLSPQGTAASAVLDQADQ